MLNHAHPTSKKLLGAVRKQLQAILEAPVTAEILPLPGTDESLVSWALEGQGTYQVVVSVERPIHLTPARY